MKKRKIDQRFKPSVKGIDLWQAMNYVALADVSRDFIANGYTSSTICYVPGSRSVLEKIARKIVSRARNPLPRVALLARYVAAEVRWAGYYERKTGRRLPDDRNWTEERILQSGFGWCNEQARLFCTLAQISGIPARLVFGGNRQGTYGHVVTEVLTGKGWLLIDQSFGYCFLRAGRPVSAWELGRVPGMAGYFRPRYRTLCDELATTVGRDILSRDFAMALAEDPLRGFESLGYCNHFV